MFNINKTKWKLINYIIRHIVESDGVVFGGAVRDTIRHNYCSTRFYKKHNNDMDKYDDVEFDVENIDRLLVPRDIDCYFKSKEDFEEFRDNLGKDNYFVDSCSSAYNEVCETFSKTKLYIKPKMHKLLYYMLKDAGVDLSTLRVEVDVMWLNNGVELSHPFEAMDFDVNCLIFDKHSTAVDENGKYTTYGEYMPRLNQWAQDGINNAYEHSKKLHDIIENIIKKKAVIINHMRPRVAKMIDKGWRIVDSKTFQPLVAIPKDEPCLICLSDVTHANHYMRKCCNAHYHDKCLQKVLASCTSCPQCRKAF